MGAIISLPSEMTPAAALTRLDSILSGAGDDAGTKMQFMSFDRLPAKSPAPAGTIKATDFATANAQQPATMLFAYPADRKLDLNDRVLLDVFLNVFAGSPTTNLYKKFVDSKTREVDTGAQGVYSYVDDVQGFPVYVGLSDVPTANLTSDKAAVYRQKIAEEFAKVAAFKDGSPELKEFNDRFANALIDYRRNLSKFVNTPPGFGFRNGGNGYGWMMLSRYLNADPAFRKSVTYRPQVENAQKLIASGRNFWRELLPKWGLADTQPYVVYGRAEPKLIEQEQTEKNARASTKAAELKTKYGVGDDQDAIRRYRADYDATTAELEKLDKGVEAKFIDNPPLSLDPQLDYKDVAVGPVKMGVSTFDNMTGSTTGISLRLDAANDNELVYVSLLPALLRNVGVIKDGKAISFDEMSEMIRKEILSLETNFTGFAAVGRNELTIRGAGNDPAESERAVRWMKLILENPNWTRENLPRIRDVVEQQLSGFRSRMQGSEESWVGDPADAYRYQSDPRYLAAFSFLTQAHNAHRLSWMLKDAGSADDKKAIDGFLSALAKAKGSRAELDAMLIAMLGAGDGKTTVAQTLQQHIDAAAKLPAKAGKLAKDAATDLQQSLNDIPDNSLTADWAYLCDEMRADLAQGPDNTLADLQTLRKKILNANSSRMFYIGGSATRAKVEPAARDLVDGLSTTAGAKPAMANARSIDIRLAERIPGAAPIYVGLMAPNMTGGVIQNSATLTDYKQIDRDHILDYLAAKLYGGGGNHSVFSKTIGAGLAYSNGVSSSPSTGTINYYAERTPEMPQTLKFAIGEVKRPMDQKLDDYVIAQVFYTSRSSSPYEVRGEAMAANVVDGLTPDVVAAFRKAVLDARKIPELSAELYKRKDRVYERILPGYGVSARNIVGRNFFVIGPEKQMAAYEAYLRSVEGQDVQLYRLYPRDFWLVRK